MKNTRKFTLIEIADHFKVLGIRPFWYPNCEMPEKTHMEPFYSTTVQIDVIEELETDRKICSWESPGMCVFCLSSPVDGINIPCGHAETCE